MRLILIIGVFALGACGTTRPCGDWRDVQRFDNKPFKAENWPNYDRATLVSAKRDMRYNWMHTFLTDSSVTIKRPSYEKGCIGACYLIRKSCLDTQ